MLQQVIQRIREKIRHNHYDITIHAMEEMAEDSLDIFDVEQVILGGKIIRTEKDDPRGTRYVILGTAVNRQIQVEVVGRFTSIERYLIVTVYEITD